MKEQLIITAVSACLIFVLTLIISRKVIPILKSHKVGQKILDIGPRWHKSKEGTPTMGGICFILAILFVMTGVFVYYGIKGRANELIPLALTLGLATVNGMIGFIDDYTKLVKKQNEGLLAWQKFMLQLAAAVIYVFVLARSGHMDTVLRIPFTDIEWDMGALYYVFALVLITGMVNAVNLTDGIDGLASSITLVIGIFLAGISVKCGNFSLGYVSSSLVGGTLGFLFYNFYPARVFMGDTGSLFLGGMVVGSAFVMDNPLLAVVYGLMFVIETLSVMLQVGYFKLTHKRLFKMAPIHHHFEKCGWSEVKIVAVFSLLTAVFCAVAAFGVR